jgi:NAD(P)H-flavin reductase
MPPKKSVIKVISKDKLSESVWGVRFEYPEKVALLPGQYVSLKVNDQGMRRSYSVAGVGETTIDLVVDVSPGGLGSKFFEALVVGQEVEAIGFMGSFVLEQETYKMKNAIFVATGTGIAPYYPMVALLLEKGFEGKVYLAWGMRYEKDLYWWEKLEEIKEKNKNFDYEIV